MRKVCFAFVVCLPVLAGALGPFKTIHAQNFDALTVADSLDTPWELQWGPDDHIWFTERKGNVKKVNPRTGKVRLISRIQEVRESSEGGLMGMVLHPNFNDTAWVFLAYNHDNEQGNYKVKIVRYTYEQGSLKAPVTIIGGIEGSNIHDGCRLVISPQRKLYISTGDAGQANNFPQNKQSPNGKILRLNLDGSVPSSNPIAGNPMWSYGHRNPQGLIMANGKLYSSEHGPNTDDELNLIKKNRNYGWPAVKGFCDEPSEETFCQNNNVVEPLKAWTPTEAVCGIAYYDHSLFNEWRNSIFMATLGFSQNDGRTLFQMKLNEAGNAVVETNRLLANEFGRLRDVMVGPDGNVYVATSNRDGRGSPAGRDDRIIKLAKNNTGKKAEPASQGLNVFPIPADNRLRVESEKPFPAGLLTLYNAKGKKVLSRRLSGKNSYNLSVGDLSPGSYFLRLTSSGQSEASLKKVIIQ